MAIVEVNKNLCKVDPLYQWDINRSLEIHGLSVPNFPEIHFTNDAMEKAIVRQATMDDKGVITTEIPNSLLQKPYNITAYVCIYEGETFKSLYKFIIPVKARKMPADYTIQDNDGEVYSFNALENLVNNTVIELTQKCDDTIAETERLKDTAIGEMNELMNTGLNDMTEIKNETIDECEKIKEEILNTSYDALAKEIEEMRNNFDNHVTEMTPISQIVEGSEKPITSGAIHSLKTELNDSLGEQPHFVYDETGKITGYTTKIGGADSVFPFSNNRKYVNYKTKSAGRTDASMSIYIYDDVLIKSHLYDNDGASYGKDILGLATLSYTGKNGSPVYKWKLTFSKDVLVNDIPYAEGKSILWDWSETVEYKIVDNT